MGLTHVAFRWKLKEKLGVQVELFPNGEFPTTFRGVLQLLREHRDRLKPGDAPAFRAMNEDELWTLICDAVRAARCDDITITPDTATASVMTF